MSGPARIPASLVGSYAQPDWLIDRERLRGRFPPRVRARELWRVDPAYLEEAQDDASRLAIADQERAGLDIVTDGEMRRESYSNRFATALEGVDIDNPGSALDRSGHPNPVPRVVGPVARRHPVQVRDRAVPRARTRAAARRSRCRGRSPCPSRPRTTTTARRDKLGLAYAEAVRAEILDLFAAGADVVQVDEPYMQARPEAAREYGLEVLRHATDGIAGTTALHICFGYAAIIHDRPSGYSFLPELAATECDQISIETAQSGLALDVLDALAGKTIILGVLDLSTDDGRDARDRGRADPPRVPARRGRAPGRRAGLRHEVPPARRRLPQARGARGRGATRRGRGRVTPGEPPRPGVSHISQAYPDRVEVRGRDLCGDLMGRVSFTEYVHLLLTGDEPTEDQRFFLDVLLVAIAEHGMMPTNVAARMTLAADPGSLQGAVAAGILGAGPVVLGTSEACARLLAGAQAEVDAGGEPAAVAARVASAIRAAGERAPGFGHPVHRPLDPRAERILALADARGVSGPHVELARRMRDAVAEAWGRPLTMNVAMPIAAVMLDLGFSPATVKAVPILARTAGLLAHLAEEREQPLGFRMAAAAEDAVEYER